MRESDEARVRALLAKAKSDPSEIATDILEVFDYKYPRQPVTVRIEAPEFTSVCPMTGLPDFGTVTIVYVPDKLVLELKAVKFYLMQYRNVGIFYEHVTNRILDDLFVAASPAWMSVEGRFTARGGVSTVVTAQRGARPTGA